MTFSKPTKTEIRDTAGQELCDTSWDTGKMLEKMAKNTPRLPLYIRTAMENMANVLQWAAVEYENANEEVKCESLDAEAAMSKSPLVSIVTGVPSLAFTPGSATAGSWKDSVKATLI